MAIAFIEVNNQLILIYSSDEPRWLDKKLDENGEVTISKVFTFNSNDKATLPSDEAYDDDRLFVLGVLVGANYKIAARKLGLAHDVFLSDKLKINRKTFIAQTNISVFRKIGEVVDESITVSDEEQNSIPINEFYYLLNNFPTLTELRHYSHARIAGVVKDYFSETIDAQKKFDVFLNKKKTIEAASKVKWISEYEVQKFKYLREILEEMLDDAERYSEAEWQKLIAEFLILIFPKYVSVIEEVPVRDFYTNPSKPTNRFIDIALVDTNGNIDIIEVKKPFENALISVRKYRDNYVPKKELSGSIVQVEKYIFHLSKSGKDGEKRINDKYKSELPSGMEIKITNPKGIVILGRDSNLDDNQRFDFEIIRRKYANILDIMTFDDLLRRIDNIIEKYSV